MDPITALCLSVPVAVGLCVAAWITVVGLNASLRVHARTTNEGLMAVAENVSGGLCAAATSLSEAYVKAAKYEAKIIKAKQSESAEELSIFQKWRAAGGASKPMRIQDEVEWAIDRLLGEVPDSQGGDDEARAVLAEYAVGVQAMIDEHFRKGGAKP